jgi:hypothetical protein
MNSENEMVQKAVRILEKSGEYNRLLNAKSTF